MASLTIDKNGNAAVYVKLPEGGRRPVRLGKIGRQRAERIRELEYKPRQNLRVSRATELADEFPSHVCVAWLGHSEAVADEFYRQVTDEHFARAVQGDGERCAVVAQGGASKTPHPPKDALRRK